MTPTLILLGHVGRAHGLRGAIRLHPASGRAKDSAPSLTDATLFIDGQPRRVLRVRPDKDELLVELEGLVDRNGAEALRGREVRIDRAHLPAPSDEELYLNDLVGCGVERPCGTALGIVKGSYDSGGHEVLIVDADGKELLLPYVPAFVVSVDLDARRIVYDPPLGLVDPKEVE